MGFAKLFATCGLTVVFLLGPEVLPTPIRSTGTGVIALFGMVGMVVTPHVLHVCSFLCLPVCSRLTSSLVVSPQCTNTGHVGVTQHVMLSYVSCLYATPAWRVTQRHDVLRNTPALWCCV